MGGDSPVCCFYGVFGVVAGRRNGAGRSEANKNAAGSPPRLRSLSGACASLWPKGETPLARHACCVSVLFDAGFQEQEGAQLLDLARDPDNGVDQGIGVTHGVDRGLTFNGAHLHCIDPVIND